MKNLVRTNKTERSSDKYSIFEFINTCMIFCCNFPLSCTLVLLRPCFVKKNKRYKRFTWVSYFESLCLPCRVHTRFKNLILIIVHKEYRGMHSVHIKKNEDLKCQAWIFIPTTFNTCTFLNYFQQSLLYFKY